MSTVGSSTGVWPKDHLIVPGAKLRIPGASPGQFVLVTTLPGRRFFLGINSDDDVECPHFCGDPWEPYVPPPARYVVEVRRPQVDETYLLADGSLVLMREGHANMLRRPVVIEQL